MASIKRKKHELDATNQAPGRLATQIATLLSGKHKASFVAHRDMGDKVVVINADKILFTGKKLEQKEFLHHTMHPGGLKRTPVKKVMTEKPEDVIRHAVVKMLPKNKLREPRLLRLSFK
jgi:large subunit ribosomal protein L13